MKCVILYGILFRMLEKSLRILLIIALTCTTLPVAKVQAQPLLGLSEPGSMVNVSPAFQPPIIKGLTVHKDNPFLFDFIVDVGQEKLSGVPLKAESEKLIKCFLASLAIPEKDLWVNLSPYEKDRTIPEALSQTDMGRDLLAQDYVLKQLTASLIYPEKELGKAFWDQVYAKAQQMYGSSVQLPVNTFNKVWIMADKADVFERNQTVFVVEGHLKVMLEEDYVALNKNNKSATSPKGTTASPQGTTAKNSSTQILKEVILPELEKEVNTGKNFANLRQIFNSLILASWYKKNLKEALLNQVYADQSKVQGIDIQDKAVQEQIYERYLEAYKKGVFNYIKQDVHNGQAVLRKYFSGGLEIARDLNPAQISEDQFKKKFSIDNALVSVAAGVDTQDTDAAMETNPKVIGVTIGREKYREEFLSSDVLFMIGQIKDVVNSTMSIAPEGILFPEGIEDPMAHFNDIGEKYVQAGHQGWEYEKLDGIWMALDEEMGLTNAPAAKAAEILRDLDKMKLKIEKDQRKKAMVVQRPDGITALIPPKDPNKAMLIKENLKKAWPVLHKHGILLFTQENNAAFQLDFAMVAAGKKVSALALALWTLLAQDPLDLIQVHTLAAQYGRPPRTVNFLEDNPVPYFDKYGLERMAAGVGELIFEDGQLSQRPIPSEDSRKAVEALLKANRENQWTDEEALAFLKSIDMFHWGSDRRKMIETTFAQAKPEVYAAYEQYLGKNEFDRMVADPNMYALHFPQDEVRAQAAVDILVKYIPPNNVPTQEIIKRFLVEEEYIDQAGRRRSIIDDVRGFYADLGNRLHKAEKLNEFPNILIQQEQAKQKRLRELHSGSDGWKRAVQTGIVRITDKGNRITLSPPASPELERLMKQVKASGIPEGVSVQSSGQGSWMITGPFSSKDRLAIERHLKNSQGADTGMLSAETLAVLLVAGYLVLRWSVHIVEGIETTQFLIKAVQFYHNPNEHSEQRAEVIMEAATEFFVHSYFMRVPHPETLAFLNDIVAREIHFSAKLTGVPQATTSMAVQQIAWRVLAHYHLIGQYPRFTWLKTQILASEDPLISDYFKAFVRKYRPATGTNTLDTIRAKYEAMYQLGVLDQKEIFDMLSLVATSMVGERLTFAMNRGTLIVRLPVFQKSPYVKDLEKLERLVQAMPALASIQIARVHDQRNRDSHIQLDFNLMDTERGVANSFVLGLLIMIVKNKFLGDYSATNLEIPVLTKFIQFASVLETLPAQKLADKFLQIFPFTEDSERFLNARWRQRDLSSPSGVLELHLLQSIIDKTWLNDAAMDAGPGGIDLNIAAKGLNLHKAGTGVIMNVDPVMLKRYQQEGIERLSPVIFSVTPVASIWPLLGL